MNVNFITPPHTAGTIRRCLSFAEQISDHQNVELFLDLSSESALEEDTQMSVLTGDETGFTPDDPMALVQFPTRQKPASASNAYHVKAKYNRRMCFLLVALSTSPHIHVSSILPQ
jgi:hypothetical protein